MKKKPLQGKLKLKVDRPSKWIKTSENVIQFTLFVFKINYANRIIKNGIGKGINCQLQYTFLAQLNLDLREVLTMGGVTNHTFITPPLNLDHKMKLVILRFFFFRVTKCYHPRKGINTRGQQ